MSLRRLPAELRNRVYHLVLPSNAVIDTRNELILGDVDTDDGISTTEIVSETTFPVQVGHHADMSSSSPRDHQDLLRQQQLCLVDQL